MEQPKDLFEQYIDTIPSGQMRINAKGMWKWAEPYLAEKGEDLLETAEEDFIGMLSDCRPISPATVRGWILMLRSFFTWCQATGKTDKNPAAGITYKDIDYSVGMRDVYWPNYLKLLNTLNQVWTPDEGLPVYPVTVFAWVGVPCAAAGILRSQCVDLRNAVIAYEGQGIHLTPEMTDILTRYQAFSSAKRDNHLIMLRTYQSDAFLYRLAIQNRTASESSSKPVNATYVLNMASQTLTSRHLCGYLKYRDLAKSGCLHHMYMMECEGYNCESISEYGREILKTPAAYPGDVALIYSAYKKAFDFK